VEAIKKTQKKPKKKNDTADQIDLQDKSSNIFLKFEMISRLEMWHAE